MHSIRAKITAITVAAILTTILMVFAASYATLHVENDRKSVEIMNLIAADTGKSLDTYFESIQQSVEMAGNLAGDILDSIILVENGAAGTYAADRERTPEQNLRLDEYLSTYCHRIQEAFESVASHTQGVVTYYYCINPEISEQEQGFLYSKIGKTGFDRRTPVDVRSLDPDDVEHTTWYYTSIQRGRPSWVGPYKSAYDNELWICSYLVPVYRAGALIGVLGMDIPIDTLIEQVNGIRLYKTGYACLFDEKGRAIYHPSLERFSIPDNPKNTFTVEMISGTNNGSELIRYAKDGVRWQMSYVTLSNGMKLIVTAPEREINASWGRLIRVILLITVGIIVIFTILLMVVMKFILHPMQELTEASKQLAEEEYDVELGYESRDEVGVLTAAFKQMRDKLQSSIEDLNRRVYTDALTGLPNMRRFFQLAKVRRSELLEAGRSPVILYLNLIGMHHYNQQYGFEEGDRLIQEIGAILARYYGEQSVCRFSEDHFAAITDEQNLEAVLENVLRSIQKANGQKSLPVRVGIYPFSLEDTRISVACDRAKYASDQYRGIYESGVYYFDSKMLSQGENVRYIISHLDQALSEHWIQVYYQPIVRAVDGRVCDEEALCRWIDPVRGTLSPAEFIPVLEDSRLIYRVDIYVLEQVLEKLRQTQAVGLTVVPHSVNLSRSDFDACDIVEEIRRRVDASGFPRNVITIEITESIIGSDFEFMREQVNRFRNLGFPVWMDDFGSGYSSLDVLQSIQFDLLKFDMSFMKRLDESEASKIILTELMKMATSLGLDTLCEGVETAEHVGFLQEIGCLKLQGYYYCRPIPFDQILERNRTGRQIGYEDPKETAYYETIGRTNLFDLAVLTNDEVSVFQNYFNTLPMAILEVRDNQVRFIRTNHSYREFTQRFFKMNLSQGRTEFMTPPQDMGSMFMHQVIQCCADGGRIFFDEQMQDGSTVHSFIRRIGVNSARGTAAAAVAVISITNEAEGTTYASIARALAADYYNIYYVDLQNGDFIEYSSTVGREDMAMERHGTNFFESARRDTMTRIYEPDREAFLSIFTKDAILARLDEQGVFTTSYRLIDTGDPIYVSMKIMRMLPDRGHIIIGISNVDAQMKQKEAEDRLRQEAQIFRRFAALSGNYMSMYTVNPETDTYLEFSTTKDYESLGLAKSGKDFFNQARANGKDIIDRSDLPNYLEAFTKENILRSIKETGIYTLHYHLLINGTPVPVTLTAAQVEEDDGTRLIFGVRRDR